MTTPTNNQPSIINLQQQLDNIAEYWAPKEGGKINGMVLGRTDHLNIKSITY